MPTIQRSTHRRRAGLASYTSLVSLGPARALSSYARRHFHAKYEGRHEHPRVIFAFDAALLGVCAILLALLVSVTLRPARPPSLTLNLTTPSLRSAVPVPLIVKIGATKDAHNVRLQWRLPPGTEILSSEPVVGADGRVFLGDVTPGQTLLAHLVVRLFQPIGATASFGFKLTSEEDSRTTDSIGSEDRPVVGSALTAKVPDELQVDSVASQGAMIPVVIENTSSNALPYVQVTFDPVIPELGERVTLGNLAGHEKRYIFVPVRPIGQTANISWVVSSAAREVSRGAWTAGVRDWKWSTILGPLVSRPGVETHIRVNGTDPTQYLLVVHPLLHQPVRQITLDEGEHDVVLPWFRGQQTPAHEWFVAPLFPYADAVNTITLGPATMGVIRTAIPFETSVRFTSREGDQIGAGPNPPKVGQDTRYWVFWTIGPVADDVRDVVVQTTLPRRVRATGNVTSPNGGAWVASGTSVSWSLPRLGGTDASEALFGFEVAVTPQTKDIGRDVMVVATSTATAADDSTDTTFRMQAGPATSVLEEDSGKDGAGLVLP